MPTRRQPRKPPTTITPEHISAIKLLSVLDVIQSEIARRLGISVSAVARVQARHGIGHLSRAEGRAASLARRV